MVKIRSPGAVTHTGCCTQCGCDFDCHYTDLIDYRAYGDKHDSEGKYIPLKEPRCSCPNCHEPNAMQEIQR